MSACVCLIIISTVLAIGTMRLRHRADASSNRFVCVWLLQLAPLPLLLSLSLAGTTLANIAGLLVVVIQVFLAYRGIDRLILQKMTSERFSATAERNYNIQEQKYAALSKYTQEVRAARHDLRHHLSVIEEYIANGDREELKKYVAGIGNSAAFESNLSVCGNFAVDAIARHYLDIARQEDTTLNIELDVPENIGIPSADLCIVVGNCLENAVEAVAKTAKGKRIIRIRSQNTESRFTLVVGNSYTKAIKDAQGRFRSTKQPEHEGFGLSSIRAVAKKYNGEAFFDTKDGMFTTSVILFKPEARL